MRSALSSEGTEKEACSLIVQVRLTGIDMNDGRTCRAVLARPSYASSLVPSPKNAKTISLGMTLVGGREVSLARTD